MERIKFFSRLSIKTMLIISLTFIIMTALITTYQSYFVRVKTFNEYKSIAEAILAETTSAIEDWANDAVGIVKLISKSEAIKRAIENPADENTIKMAKKYLDETMKDYPYYVDISLISLKDKNNLVKIISTVNKSSYESNIKAKDIIKAVLNGSSYYYGSVYRNEHTDEVVLPLGSPVYINGELRGVVIIESKPDYFLKYINILHLKNYDASMSIMDEKGKIIAHIDKTMVFNKEIEEHFKYLIDTTKKGMYIKEGILKGVSKYYFIKRESESNEYLQYKAEPWYVLLVFPKNTLNKVVWANASKMLLLNIIYLITILMGVFIINKIFIQRPLKMITNSLMLISSGVGDLSQRLEVKTKDEFYLLTKYYNKSIETIANIIIKVKELINSVSSASAQVSSSMEETSRTVEEQTSQLSEIASSVEELSASGNSEKEIVEEAKKKAVEARDKTYKGSEIINNVINLINKVGDNSSSLAETIRRLTASTSKISSIVDVINEIADQTNLLALNAAIEAARAGEAGRGFAVVAEEVRKLAERTTSSTKEILDIITDVGREVEYVDKQMNETESSVEKSKQSATEADAIFKDIVEIVDAVYESSNQIEQTVNEQINALVKTNDNVQVISSASEETSRAVMEVTNTITNLQKELEELKALIDNFRT